MKLHKILKPAAGLMLTAISALALSGLSTTANAADAQIYSGWECRATGAQNHSSAQNIQYRFDGSVVNLSTTSSINVVCPVRTKDNAKFLEYYSMNYTDNNPSRNVSCNLYVETSSGRKAYNAYSPSGTGARDLLIRNTANTGTRSWISCNIPPSYNGQKSALHSYRVQYNTDTECGWWPGCWDNSGVHRPTQPGTTARLTEKQPEAQPYFYATYVGNLSYDYSLPVVFPLMRDDSTSNEAPHVSVSASLKTDNIGLAQCRLVLNNSGVESSFDMNWVDNDGDGEGSFFGTANDNLVNSTTQYAVHCDIPPRSSQGWSRLSWITIGE